MMEKEDDDILALELAAELSEKQKELLARIIEIERELKVSNAPPRHARNLIFVWIARKMLTDAPDDVIRQRIREAYHQAKNIGANIYGRPGILPSLVYARRAALRK
jgi:transcriptional accessory protein Tex/SPT6